MNRVRRKKKALCLPNTPKPAQSNATLPGAELAINVVKELDPPHKIMVTSEWEDRYWNIRFSHDSRLCGNFETEAFQLLHDILVVAVILDPVRGKLIFYSADPLEKVEILRHSELMLQAHQIQKPI